MNRRAQTPFTVVLWLAVAAFAFFMFLGPWLQDNANAAVAQHSMTGWEGFLMSNMALWIIIAAIIFVMVVLSFGGNQ